MLTSPVGSEVLKFVRSLQPAWWLARAYIATVILGMLTNGYGWRISLFPRVAGSPLVGLLVLAALTAASVALSRISRRHRWLLAPIIVANIWFAIAGVGTLAERLADSATYTNQQFQQPQQTSVVGGPYGPPILNIYPYAADGTPLKDVLLFDQNGNPIPGVAMDRYAQELGLRDQHGQLIPNAFPYPEAVIDARTGEIVGARPVPPMPLRVPPKLPGPSMSAQASPSAEPTISGASPTAPPSPSTPPTESASETSPATVAPSPTVSASPSPSATAK